MSQFSDFWRDVAADPVARRACEEADLVELQWFEMALTAGRAERLGVDVPVWGVYHDVVTQKLERELDGARGRVEWSLRWIRLQLTRNLERRTAKVLSMSLCLSEKDATLLRRLASDPSRVAVIDPPLDGPEVPDELPELSARPPTALLVGDFSRAANAESARWILNDIWPRVFSGDAERRLVLAGGGMDDELARQVAQTPGASATGYLPSLLPMYAEARVAISPPRKGAGIKFKSITPMLMGVPVVATEVGAEGIERGLFHAVEDQAPAMSGAIADVLADPSCADATRARAFAASRARYSTAGHIRRMHDLYDIEGAGNLRSGRRPRSGR